MTELIVKGEEFVVIPKAEYLRMKREIGEEAEGDDIEFMEKAIGQSLRKAREFAGLTQAELAKRLKRSQALVSSAENGNKDIGIRYVKSVLTACGLPEDWKP